MKKIHGQLSANNALERTVIIAADSTLGAPVITLAADAALTIADYFREQGNEVLLVIDDLGTHAKYLREVSLLSQTLPGREAYPGDIFYQHAHLLERVGNFNEHAGNGTITLLPLIEADLENFSTLIPTNLMASTDGHLLFSTARRAQGYYPAINIDDSVTRVGRKTQHPLLMQLADRIRPQLVEYQNLKNYGIFGTELGDRTQEGLRQGAVLHELLTQDPHHRLSITSQILLLSLAYTSFLKTRDAQFVREHKTVLLAGLEHEELTALVTESNHTLDTLLKALDTKRDFFEDLAQSAQQQKKEVKK